MKTLTLLSFLSLLCWVAQPSIAAETIDVSIVQLIANPQQFDGKIVRIIGFARLEFEGDSIYLHREDYEHGITKNGLWMDVPNDMRKRDTEFDQKYILIEGRFNAKFTGHMGMWSGSIEKISRFEVWDHKPDRK
jgi:hypothetical protein